MDVGDVGGVRAASCAGIGRASRLTAPTRGRLLLHRVQGRVSSVAPDTTGYVDRQLIYLDIYTTRYLDIPHTARIHTNVYLNVVTFIHLYPDERICHLS